MTVSKAEFQATVAKRMRELRLSLGYKTAASFAQRIGYPPDKYSRYEHQGFTRAGPMILLVLAIEQAGLGKISFDWLCDVGTKRKWLRPPARRAVRVEGNVLHAAFGS